MSAQRCTCWLIGNAVAAEFADLVAWLKQHCDLYRTEDMHAIANIDPDWVILLQLYPGEHDAHQVAKLRGQYPLASFLVAYGRWCAGELRTGQPLPGVERSPAISAVGRLQAWEHRGRAWPTFTAADYAAQPSQLTCDTIALALAAKTREEYSGLKDLLTTAGMKIVEPHAAQAWLVAGDDLRDSFTSQQVSHFFESNSSAAGWVLLNQPQPHESDWLQQHGVRHIFAKPCDMRDLLASFSS
jgi:hypothetical protein